MDIVTYAAAVKKAKSMIDEHVADLPVATENNLGAIIVGKNLSVTNEGVVSVQTADHPEEDNTRPITASAVYTEIGNINALLATI